MKTYDNRGVTDCSSEIHTISETTCEERDVAHDHLSDVLEAEERPAIPVVLPDSGRSVAVPTVLRRETRWSGVVPESFRVVPNNPALAFRGHLLYPEFIL